MEEKEPEGLMNSLSAVQRQWPGASVMLVSLVWDAAVLWDGPLGKGPVVA